MKPKFGRIQVTTAQYGTSSVTYNQSGYTYNQTSQIYGGAPRKVDPGPRIGKIKV